MNVPIIVCEVFRRISKNFEYFMWSLVAFCEFFISTAVNASFVLVHQFVIFVLCTLCSSSL